MDEILRYDRLDDVLSQASVHKNTKFMSPLKYAN